MFILTVINTLPFHSQYFYFHCLLKLELALCNEFWKKEIVDGVDDDDDDDDDNNDDDDDW